MTLPIILTLTIIGIAVVLFSMERLPADVIALGILLALIICGLLPAKMAFAGFGSDTVLMILGLLILTAALVRTGVVDSITRAIRHRASDNPNRIFLIITAAASALSALMSNTAATAIFVPIVIDLARKARIRASKLLLPLSFASILASSITLFSSSTNLVISEIMTEYNLPALGIFELSLVGIPIAIVGLTYMYVLGRRLIPERGEAVEQDREFGIQPYLAEVVVRPNSPLIGKTLAQAGLGRDLDLTVLQVARGEQRYLAPQANLRLAAGDVLSVQGQHNRILRVTDVVGLEIKGDILLSDPKLQTENVRLVEAILLAQSSLIGRNLRQLQLRQRYGLQILGINRHGETLLSKLSEITLRVGDLLLIQGHRVNIALLEEENAIRILGAVDYSRRQPKRAPLAVAILAGVIVLAALKIVPLAAAALLGAFLVFVTRCITPEEAYHQVHWRTLILIGCLLALGSALEYTGTAKYLAGEIVRLAGQSNPIWLLSAFFVLTLLLTQPLSNQAAAIIVLPIALQTAMQAGWNPRTFAIMIAVGASCSFITPLEPACLMVYGPGRYRFFDFFRVGAILTVLIYVLAIVLVPLFWPL